MWIKICGITTIEDAAFIVDAGADAIGLNFFPGSKRCVTVDVARPIAGEVRDSVEIIGVFVNARLEQVANTVQDLGLTAVQFHGDETLSDIEQFRTLCPGVPVIRAFRVGTETESFRQQYDQYESLLPPLAGVLVDAWSRDEYGGTGQQVARPLLAGCEELDLKLILAGGLTPDNVADAATAVRPWGVDTASGVESAPGTKAESLVRRFVTECRSACPGAAKARLLTD